MLHSVRFHTPSCCTATLRSFGFVHHTPTHPHLRHLLFGITCYGFWCCVRVPSATVDTVGPERAQQSTALVMADSHVTSHTDKQPDSNYPLISFTISVTSTPCSIKYPSASFSSLESSGLSLRERFRLSCLDRCLWCLLAPRPFSLRSSFPLSPPISLPEHSPGLEPPSCARLSCALPPCRRDLLRSRASPSRLLSPSRRFARLL